ncbi:hypothetical protein HanRHA438_Chr09g0385281 [Helianthus annuus]|nr:hypothetical protein HanRHA438_Chr09g0385281 [Helianthus annuus]
MLLLASRIFTFASRSSSYIAITDYVSNRFNFHKRTSRLYTGINSIIFCDFACF